MIVFIYFVHTVGWFHEVFSSGIESAEISNNCESSASASASMVNDLPGVHMALNYWCHPPDGSSFEKPYRSEFWPIDWQRRGSRLS